MVEQNVDQSATEALRAAEAQMKQGMDVQTSEPPQEQGKQPEPAENQKEMLVANHKVLVETDEDGQPIKVSNPEGLEGEALENWKKQAENEIKALAVSSAKYKQAKDTKNEVLETMSQLEQREASLRERELEFKRKQEEFNKDKTQKETQARIHTNAVEYQQKFTDRVMEVLGVKTKEEFDDKMAEDALGVTGVIERVRKEFELADRDVLQSNINENLKQQLELTKLTDRVGSDGYDISDVIKFAKQQGLPINNDTYEYFKFRANQNTLSFQVQRLQRVKTKTVTFLPKGDMNPKLKTKPMTPQEAEEARLRNLTKR